MSVTIQSTSKITTRFSCGYGQLNCTCVDENGIKTFYFGDRILTEEEALQARDLFSSIALWLHPPPGVK